MKVAQGTPQWRKCLADFLRNGLLEIRSTLLNTIARIFFCEIKNEMILLHAIKIKKETV
ncbi:MAG: type II toxin-antitoxin system RelE/ParE family toxin [Chthoniobacterales bacterium]|nr:type II toxin-antitoxin system RelE/ParE family toxin [Chthoniobacterales bacterium]